MADRIEIVNGVGQMAFRSTVPWHGKGYGLTSEDLGALSGMSPTERVSWWLKASSMDFEVQRRAMAMRDGEGNGLLVDPLSKYRAIVRKDTNQVFQVATDRYHPIQNEEIVGFFSEYCDAGNAHLETVGGIDGGAKVWALAKVAEGVVGAEDKKSTYILMASSHDGTLQTIAKGTDIYVVCWNTLSSAIGLHSGRLGEKSKGEFRMKKTRKWDAKAIKEARETIGMIVEQSASATETANVLSKVSIDDRGRKEFIKRLIGGETILEQVASNTQELMSPMGMSILDAVVAGHQSSKASEPDDLGRLGKALLEAMISSPGSDLAERRDTLWGAVNGVTYHVDHERGRNQDNRLDSAWFGDGDRLKRDSVRVALEIAGK